MRRGVWVRAMFERRGMLSEFGRGDRVMVRHGRARSLTARSGRDRQSDLKVAYGMGVHFPDVRRVYHLGSPWTVPFSALGTVWADVGI